jgi:hypothetical protein
LLTIALLALHGEMARPIEGSYLAQTMNGQPLPADLRLAATAGDFRLFRLEQGVLRLSEGRRFTLYFRYYHQLVQRGARPQSTPVRSESESGTFEVRAGRMKLTPAKTKKGRSRPQITATIVGDEIRASYMLQNGASSQRLTLILHRDASFW